MVALQIFSKFLYNMLPEYPINCDLCVSFCLNTTVLHKETFLSQLIQGGDIWISLLTVFKRFHSVQGLDKLNEFILSHYNNKVSKSSVLKQYCYLYFSTVSVQRETVVAMTQST